MYYECEWLKVDQPNKMIINPTMDDWQLENGWWTIIVHFPSNQTMDECNSNQTENEKRSNMDLRVGSSGGSYIQFGSTSSLCVCIDCISLKLNKPIVVWVRFARDYGISPDRLASLRPKVVSWISLPSQPRSAPPNLFLESDNRVSWEMLSKIGIGPLNWLIEWNGR